MGALSRPPETPRASLYYGTEGFKGLLLCRSRRREPELFHDRFDDYETCIGIITALTYKKTILKYIYVYFNIVFL